MSSTTWRGTPERMVPDDGGPAREINDVMQFHGVVQVHPDGSLTERPDLREPDLVQYKGDDETWSEFLDGEGWSLMAGWTGQYGYRGPMMHSSEFIGGLLAEHILSTPGLYVPLVPSVLDPDDENASADSWAIAFKGDDTGNHTLACRANAIGCAVMYLTQDDPGWVGADVAVQTGDGYLSGMTVDCLCESAGLKTLVPSNGTAIALGVVTLDGAARGARAFRP